MNACEIWKDRLLDLSLGALGAEAAAGVRTHLRGCPACSAEAKTLIEQHGELDRALAALANPEPPPELRARVLAEVEAHPSPPILPVVRVRLLAAAAAVLLFAGAVLQLSRPDREMQFAAEAFRWNAPSDRLLCLSGCDLLASSVIVGELYFEFGSAALDPAATATETETDTETD